MFVILISVFFFAGNAQECPYGQYYQFYVKNIDHSLPVIDNPYHKPSAEYMTKVNENLKNKERVCALRYLNQNKSEYSLKEF